MRVLKAIEKADNQTYYFILFYLGKSQSVFLNVCFRARLYNSDLDAPHLPLLCPQEARVLCAHARQILKIDPLHPVLDSLHALLRELHINLQLWKRWLSLPRHRPRVLLIDPHHLLCASRYRLAFLALS